MNDITNHQQIILIGLFFISSLVGLVLIFKMRKLNVGTDDEMGYRKLTKQEKKFKSLQGSVAMCGVGVAVGGIGIVKLLFDLFLP